MVYSYLDIFRADIGCFTDGFCWKISEGPYFSLVGKPALQVAAQEVFMIYQLINKI
jgi:hypothetical protein